MNSSRNIFEKIIQTNKFKILDPATDEMIRNAEHELKIKLPKILIEILKVSNGMIELMEFPLTKEIIPIEETFWSIESIVKLKNTDENAPFLFVSGNGCGDYFCYRINNDRIEEETIFLYYPISNEYEEVAPSLAEWLTRCC